ncbi:MAG: 6-phosphofructokinase, partial [Thermoanaerobaculales bacterium]|nr:6-phosphofructokinase [Thermoanaerobaculales bacterium]
MADTKEHRGTIGILTGGGDVPGLNPAIRAVTVRALREGFRVLGIRRGWAGLIEINRDLKNGSDFVIDLTEEVVNKVGRTGGTFLHSSRTRPSHVPQTALPDHLRERYTDDISDLTEEVLANIEYLGIDTMVPIGGDDTLSYGVHLHKKGVPVIALPKTMDNDVPGTDYCIGFSTCVTRTIAMTHALRTSAGSHERFLVIEVFGRYAGFTALLPTMAGAANRCVIPEHPFDIEVLCEHMSRDRERNPSNYSVVLVSEGATFTGESEMVYSDQEKDMFGHKKLGGV